MPHKVDNYEPICFKLEQTKTLVNGRIGISGDDSSKETETVNSGAA